MPYRKPYRRRYKKSTGDAKKALTMVRRVKKLMNVEVKNFDRQQTIAAITNVPVIIPLALIPQGDTTITRDGAQCKMIGLNLNYTIFIDASAVLTICRVMVVLDKQTNSAIFVHTDLLEDVSSGDSVVSPRNLDNKHRFTTLYDRSHWLSTSNAVVIVKKYIRREVLLRYDGPTGAIGDITQNGLSLVQMSNEATNTPIITSFIRIRFIDN